MFSLFLLKTPVRLDRCRFHFSLHIVWEVAEKVDARLRLQFVDADDIVGQLVVGVVFVQVLHPETQGFVCVTFLYQQGHEIVSGHDMAVDGLAQNLISLVDGTALADEHVVGSVHPTAYDVEVMFVDIRQYLNISVPSNSAGLMFVFPISIVRIIA